MARPKGSNTKTEEKVTETVDKATDTDNNVTDTVPEKTPEEKVAEAEAAEAAELEKAKAEEEATKKDTEKPVANTEISSIKRIPEAVRVGEETVLIFKAKRPLSVRAFKAAAEMLRSEQEKTGLKIVLMPFSAQVEK